MGNEIDTITTAFHYEFNLLKKYYRALRREDQIEFDTLKLYVSRNLPAASEATDALPMEVFLLSMILELQKEKSALLNRIESLEIALQKLITKIECTDNS